MSLPAAATAGCRRADDDGSNSAAACRRLAHHQLAGQFDTPRGGCAECARSSSSRLSAADADFAHRNVHRGQRRIAECRQRQVVHADDGDIRRHRDNRRFSTPRIAPIGEAVARGQHGGEIEAALADPLRDRLAGKFRQPVLDLDHQVVEIGRRRLPPARRASPRSAVRSCAARAASGTGCGGGRGRCRCCAASCAAERLQGVTLEWRIERIVAIDQHDRLGEAVGQRQHVVVVERQEQAARDAVVALRLRAAVSLRPPASATGRVTISTPSMRARVR